MTFLRCIDGGTGTNIKERVALISVLAAILLTVTKLTVGYLTNSLGIISEALHSGIDLIAAVMTLFAVQAAARPPDADHQFGHEKVESLSSLGEVALLFITCGWIVYEAFDRLFFHSVEVNVGIVALLVMALSMIVDFSRSRALMKVARQTKSQALEADALHFSTDLISSLMVIIGILLTMAGFKNFDSIAALGVAVVTAVIGYRLWKKSIHTLMDGAPIGISEKVTEEIMAVPGIHRVDHVRVRESGAITFVEATVYVEQTLPMEQGHRLTDRAEERVKAVIPNSDVIVHAEPLCLENATLEDRIRALGATMPEVRSIHDVVITEGPHGRLVEFHVELYGDLTVDQASESATRLEEQVAALDPCIAKVMCHPEPAGCPLCHGQTSEEEKLLVRETVEEASGELPDLLSCREVHVHSIGTGFRVFLVCQFDPGLSINKAHEVAKRLESVIRSKHAEIESVTIRLEPKR
jgi:cation diffusion facilitator family transporter